MEEDLISAMERLSAPTADTLVRVREAVQKVRDLYLRKGSLEEQLKEVSSQIREIEYKELPALFGEVGINKVEIAAQGNMPPYTAQLKAFYYANVAADWPEEKRDAAFAWLESRGAGDMIKTSVSVQFGRGTKGAVADFTKLLDEHGYVYAVRQNVQWNTLTAWVKEEVRAGRGGQVDLEAIGATVGQVVSLKPKED